MGGGRASPDKVGGFEAPAGLFQAWLRHPQCGVGPAVGGGSWLGAEPGDAEPGDAEPSARRVTGKDREAVRARVAEQGARWKRQPRLFRRLR